MKKTALVCVILVVSSLGFAETLETTHQRIYSDLQNPSRTDTYGNRSSDNMQLPYPIVDTGVLSEWREKTTSTLVVDKNGKGDFTTIQDAIDAISDSTTTNPYAILIHPGVYEISSQINLNKNCVSLIGINRPTITWDSGSDSLETIEVTGDYCSMHGLKVVNTRAPINASKTLCVNSATNFEAVDCSFIGSGRDSVQVSFGSASAKFIDCYIEGYSDINFVTQDTQYYDCRFYVSSNQQEAFYFGGQSGGSSPEIYVVDCFFDGAGNNHIGNFNDDTTTVYFYGNKLSENITGHSSTQHFEFRGNNPTLYFTRMGGNSTVEGNLTVRNGMNIGTATGAGIGDGKFSGDVTIDGDDLGFSGTTANIDVLDASANSTLYIRNSDATHKANLNVENDTVIQGGLNVGAAGGAAAGEIDTSGNISASGQKITATLFDVEHYAGGLPNAGSTYRGCLAFVQGDAGSEDRLYICVKNSDGSYAWDEIGQGTSESRVTFEQGH